MAVTDLNDSLDQTIVHSQQHDTRRAGPSVDGSVIDHSTR